MRLGHIAPNSGPQRRTSYPFGKFRATRVTTRQCPAYNRASGRSAPPLPIPPLRPQFCAPPVQRNRHVQPRVACFVHLAGFVEVGTTEKAYPRAGVTPYVTDLSRKQQEAPHGRPPCRKHHRLEVSPVSGVWRGGASRPQRPLCHRHPVTVPRSRGIEGQSSHLPTVLPHIAPGGGEGEGEKQKNEPTSAPKQAGLRNEQKEPPEWEPHPTHRATPIALGKSSTGRSHVPYLPESTPESPLRRSCRAASLWYTPVP